MDNKKFEKQFINSAQIDAAQQALFKSYKGNIKILLEDLDSVLFNIREEYKGVEGAKLFYLKDCKKIFNNQRYQIFWIHVLELESIDIPYHFFNAEIIIINEDNTHTHFEILTKAKSYREALQQLQTILGVIIESVNAMQPQVFDAEKLETSLKEALSQFIEKEITPELKEAIKKTIKECVEEL